MQHFIIVLFFTLYISPDSTQSLHIYGGKDHDVYLGCINCHKFDSKSIWNEYGTYGSLYSSTSIWNMYGLYGGEYSVYSPFNAYTSMPPILLDSQGSFYGYFTVNKFMVNRATLDLAQIICQNWEAIADDRDTWYDELF